MDDQLKKIRKLTKFMKESGLLHLKQGDIELNLAPSALDPPKPEINQPEASQEVQTFNEQDVLFWSAPGFIPEEKAN